MKGDFSGGTAPSLPAPVEAAAPESAEPTTSDAPADEAPTQLLTRIVMPADAD